MGIRLLRSILVLSEVAALVVDPGSGLFFTGFAGENAPRAVSGRSPSRRMEKCAQFCCGRLFSLEIWTLFLRTPCFAVLSAVRGLR